MALYLRSCLTSVGHFFCLDFYPLWLLILEALCPNEKGSLKQD